MTEALVDLRDEYLKEALYYLDDSNTEDQIDFYKETHDDDPIDAKEQNGAFDHVARLHTHSLNNLARLRT